MCSIKTAGFIFLTLLVICKADFYKYKVEDVKGESVSLEKYRGKVSLVVNVASLCGYTDSTYRALTKIHDILSYEGFFTVLAFPCNQFGDQEPEDSETVAETMEKEYGVEFPIFNKIDVIGENASPAFRELVAQSSKVPEWNFYKYLVNHEGEVINAYSTRTEIEEIFEEVQAAVENAKRAAGKERSDQKNTDDAKHEIKSEQAESPNKEEL